MPAGDQQKQVREGGTARDQARQAGSQGVRLQMVHGDKGKPRGQRDPLSHLRADDQPADQPWSGRGRDPAEVAEAKSGFEP